MSLYSALAAGERILEAGAVAVAPVFAAPRCPYGNPERDNEFICQAVQVFIPTLKVLSMHFPAFKVARATRRGCALGGAARSDEPLVQLLAWRKARQKAPLCLQLSRPLTACRDRKQKIAALSC